METELPHRRGLLGRPGVKRHTCLPQKPRLRNSSVSIYCS